MILVTLQPPDVRQVWCVVPAHIDVNVQLIKYKFLTCAVSLIISRDEGENGLSVYK